MDGTLEIGDFVPVVGEQRARKSLQTVRSGCRIGVLKNFIQLPRPAGSFIHIVPLPFLFFFAELKPDFIQRRPDGLQGKRLVRRRHCQRIDQRRKGFHLPESRGLIFRYCRKQAFHFADRGHGFECLVLVPGIFEVIRHQGGVPGGAFGVLDNLHFVTYRLGPLGLHVEQVVIEIQILGHVTAPEKQSQRNEDNQVIMRVQFFK